MRLARLLSAILFLSVFAAGIFLLEASENTSWEVPAEAASLENPHPATEEILIEAKELYEKKCAPCHGFTGQGDGTMAKRFGIDARDFTEPGLLAGQSDGALFHKITTGRDPMPSFEKKLPERSRWILVHHLRTFSAEREE